MDPRRKGPGEDDVAGESIVLERCGGNKEGGMEKTFLYMITEKFHKQNLILLSPHINLKHLGILIRELCQQCSSQPSALSGDNRWETSTNNLPDDKTGTREGREKLRIALLMSV